MIVAKWKVNIYKADASKVADEIASIGEEAKPEQIVERARDPESELHKCFIWDDKIAAERWRLEEARHIVRLLVIDKRDEKPDSEPVRVFFKVNNDPGTGYKQTSLIYRNEDEYKSLLRQAKAELESFRRKYRTLTELDGVFEAINEIL